MYPVIWEFGNFSLRSYGVMAAIGFLAATWVINWNRKFANLNGDQATGLVLWAMVAGVVGARIFYVIQFWQLFEHNLWNIFRIDRGGLVFYGGFFLAIGAIALFCRLNRLDLIRVLDLFTPALAIGHAAGRIGCFLNGCCYGKPTQCLLGVVYPAGSEPARRYGELALHPVQLYETGINILIFGLMLLLVRRTRRGVAMSAYLIIYGLIRFADEFFRGDHQQFWNGFTPAQVIGLGMVPVGILLLCYFQRQARVEHD